MPLGIFTRKGHIKVGHGPLNGHADFSVAIAYEMNAGSEVTACQNDYTSTIRRSEGLFKMAIDNGYAVITNKIARGISTQKSVEGDIRRITCVQHSAADMYLGSFFGVFGTR